MEDDVSSSDRSQRAQMIRATLEAEYMRASNTTDSNAPVPAALFEALSVVLATELDRSKAQETFAAMVKNIGALVAEEMPERHIFIGQQERALWKLDARSVQLDLDPYEFGVKAEFKIGDETTSIVAVVDEKTTLAELSREIRNHLFRS